MKLRVRKGIILVGLSLLIVGSAVIPSIFFSGIKSIPYESISKGSWSGIDEEVYYVINTQEEWEDLWERTLSGTSPTPPVPEINFQDKTIIAVYMGVCSSSGYSIKIKVIAQIGFQFYIHVQQISSHGFLPVVTQPYDIVETNKLGNLNINFITESLEL